MFPKSNNCLTGKLPRYRHGHRKFRQGTAAVTGSVGLA